MTIAVLISICFAVAGIMLKMKLPGLVRPHHLFVLSMPSLSGSFIYLFMHSLLHACRSLVYSITARCLKADLV